MTSTKMFLVDISDAVRYTITFFSSDISDMVSTVCCSSDKTFKKGNHFYQDVKDFRYHWIDRDGFC